MKDRDLAIFTFIGMVSLIPFLFMIITNPSGFGNDQKWSLIVLGMATVGLPISIFGNFKILLIVSNDRQNIGDVKQ